MDENITVGHGKKSATKNKKNKKSLWYVSSVLAEYLFCSRPVSPKNLIFYFFLTDIYFQDKFKITRMYDMRDSRLNMQYMKECFEARKVFLRGARFKGSPKSTKISKQYPLISMNYMYRNNNNNTCVNVCMCVNIFILILKSFAYCNTCTFFLLFTIKKNKNILKIHAEIIRICTKNKY